MVVPGRWSAVAHFLHEAHCQDSVGLRCRVQQVQPTCRVCSETGCPAQNAASSLPHDIYAHQYSKRSFFPRFASEYSVSAFTDVPSWHVNGFLGEMRGEETKNVSRRRPRGSNASVCIQSRELSRGEIISTRTERENRILVNS